MDPESTPAPDGASRRTEPADRYRRRSRRTRQVDPAAAARAAGRRSPRSSGSPSSASPWSASPSRDRGSRRPPARPRPPTRTPSGRSPVAGTRRCSTRSAGRSRTRRSMPATCSTPRSRCGMPGRPTTRPPAATSSRRSITASDATAARNEAISYAAYRRPDVALPQGRRRRRVGVRVRRRHGFAVLSARRSRRPTATRRPPLGNRIAAAVLAYGLDDGSNQANGYAAPDYKPVNPPLVVAKSGHDDDRSRTAGSRSSSST